MVTASYRTALVSMPWGAVDRPALGISLLKAGLAGRGFPCDILYLNLPFAEQLGLSTYNWVYSGLPHIAFAGDWTFAEALYGPRPADDRAYLDDHLGGVWKVSAEDRTRLIAVRTQADRFLDWCVAAYDWGRYDAVGFTSTFEQNIASLSMAKRLKARWPHLTILFGGANWEGEMGQELHARFPFVDIAVSGEADETLPRLIAALSEGGAGTALAAIPGLVVRAADGTSVATGPGEPVRDMDALATPDYSDYFAALDASGTAAEIAPTLLLETSRGCWWGAKSHCTFCGLNGLGLSYRAKSGPRALAELADLVARWRISVVSVVDNILDMTYFKTFLPGLIEARLGLELFWEIKANLSRAQVEMLADAGVRRVQPGIESLSDRLLAAMHKGTTSLRNLQLLRHCREHGVAVDWNILYGVPGEIADDYAAQRALLPAIGFLQPPGAYGPIRLDRFSPYHGDPAAFGIGAVRPVPSYRALYPFPAEALDRIAYYFDFDVAAAADPGSERHAFLTEVDAWMRAPDPGALVAWDDGVRLQLDDTRRDAPVRTILLTGAERTLYLACDDIRSPAAAAEAVRRRHADRAIDDAAAGALLDRWADAGLMARQGGLYLSLALRPPAGTADALAA